VASARRWIVLQHVAHEGPGEIGIGLRHAGHDVSLVRIDLGHEVPEAGDVTTMAGLVVMGGPMGVHDLAHTWLAGERDLMAAAVQAGLPVLGVCLGAQQLALALGGEVTTGPVPEIGPGAVNLTRQAETDPVFGPVSSPLPCLHWHGDTFSLPPGGVLLARSTSYPHQAFRYGDRAYGLQFHVEVTPSLAEQWQSHLPPGTDLAPADVATIAGVGRGLVRRFIALAPPAV
jgi:GMP synthase (glutamine-hydrolysing)